MHSDDEKGSAEERICSIVVVDDDDRMARAIRRALILRFKERVRVRIFFSPAEALADATRDPPDILITDYQMPEMEGPALIASVRQAAPAVRVLLLSGDDGALARLTEAARKDPSLATMEKPFVHETLLQWVEKSMAPPTSFGD